MKTLKDYVVTIPNFPKEGIMFRDVTSILADADGLALAIDELVKHLEGVEYDAIAGLESRGFVFGMPVAYKEHKPFLLIRKAGKLPRETVQESYDLEYGKASIEMHKEDLKPGMRVVLIDDLIATGGTAEAGCRLIERLGGTVAKVLFVMELEGLEGRKKLAKYDVDTCISYEGK